MSDNNKLTTKAYWDRIWNKESLPVTVDVQGSPGKYFHRIFSRTLSPGRDVRFLEIGCAPGKWLLYFRRNFGYRIFGIELSTTGYEKTVENLSAAGESGSIVAGDFLAVAPPEKMDIVFSYGVVEHFKDAEGAVRRHLEFLGDTGTVIVMVPNLQPVYTVLQSLTDRSILEGHQKIDIDALRRIAQRLGIEEIFLDYVCPFNLGLINWSTAPRPVQHLANVLNKCISGVIEAFGLHATSKTFSPYILLIGKKRPSR